MNANIAWWCNILDTSSNVNSPGLQAQGVLEPEDEPHAFSLRSFSALLALAKSLGGAQTPCI